jgi:nucleotide-binding universal stress UspA family protein
MSVLVAVTDSREGLAAFEAAVHEAAQLNVGLIAVNLTGADLDTSAVSPDLAYEVVVPSGPADIDEVEQVLREIETRPDVTRLVVGVRKRSAIGKAVLGSIAQRLLLEVDLPVLAVKAGSA